jgi:hypothetical protein
VALIKLENIRLVGFEAEDRNNVERAVARAVESDPERFIERYRADERSFGGRFVSADLFKETFPEYAASRESRNRYNAPVHNSAAVLASAHLRNLLRDNGDSERDTVVFLTGTPGAGKTSGILHHGELLDTVRAVFEGQLADPETAFEKIRKVINEGLGARIQVVHARPDDALINTLRRHYEHGRGASVNVMAKIQGSLPDTLAAVREEFGDRVALSILDVRDRWNVKALEGWNHIDVLKSEGSYDEIKRKLTAQLDRYRRNGVIGDDAFRQAAGQKPLNDIERMGSGDATRRSADERGRGIPEEDRGTAFLKRAFADSNLHAAEQIKQAGLIPRDASVLQGSVRGEVIAVTEFHAGVRLGTLIAGIVDLREFHKRPQIGDRVDAQRSMPTKDRGFER